MDRLGSIQLYPLFLCCVKHATRRRGKYFMQSRFPNESDQNFVAVLATGYEYITQTIVFLR